MTIKAFREGASSESGLAILEVGRLHAYRNFVVLSHSEPRGYGESCHEIRIDADSFADLAQTMMHANPEATIKAFGCALQAGIPDSIPADKVWYPDVGISN
jgi:hypothetical protein